MKVPFLYRFKISIISPKKYYLLYRESFRRSIIYGIIISLICGVVGFSRVVYEYRDVLIFIEHQIKDNFPEFTFKNGVLTVQGDKVIYLNTDKGVDIIFDTSNTLDQDALENGKRGFLIQSDRIFYKNNGKVDEMRFSLFKNFSINKEEFIKYMIGFKGWVIILFLASPLLFLVWNIFLYFIVSLIAFLIVSIFKWDISVKDIFKLSIYASTTSNILNSAIMILFHINPKINYAYIALTLIYLLYGIKCINSKLSEDQ